MTRLATDEIEITIHYGDYFSLPSRVRSMIEMYAYQPMRRTNAGLVFVIQKNRWPEIQEAMDQAKANEGK